MTTMRLGINGDLLKIVELNRKRSKEFQYHLTLTPKALKLLSDLFLTDERKRG
jgi:hypothetical protein